MARVRIREGNLRRFDGQVRAGLLKAAYEIQRQAQAEAPVRGGYRSFDPGGPVGGTLRRSAFARATASGAEVGFSAHYAGFVELGTVKMPARPFLLPAVQRVRGRIGEFIRQATR
jgi:HK97 gp10 family phage protein